jgi:hypothetical protein
MRHPARTGGTTSSWVIEKPGLKKGQGYSNGRVDYQLGDMLNVGRDTITKAHKVAKSYLG